MVRRGTAPDVAATALALPAIAEDAGSADLFIQRLTAHEKAAWMLRSTLEEDVAA